MFRHRVEGSLPRKAPSPNLNSKRKPDQCDQSGPEQQRSPNPVYASFGTNLSLKYPPISPDRERPAAWPTRQAMPRTSTTRSAATFASRRGRGPNGLCRRLLGQEQGATLHGADLKSECTGKVQSIGSFETAQQAAIAYTRAMMDGDGQDMDSPLKRQPKGTACHSPPPPPLPCMPSCLCQHAYVWPGRPTGSLQPSRSVTGTLV